MRCADFGPTPGQAAELVDERLDRRFVRAAHASAEQPSRESPRLPRSRPPVTPPRLSLCSSCARRRPSPTAASTRSSSISTSSGSTTSGAMLHRLHLAGAGDDDLHHAAARRALDRRLGQRVLRRGHVGLHLLHLLHHLVQSDHRCRAGIGGRPLDPSASALRRRQSRGTSSTTVAPRLWVMRLTESTAGTVGAIVDQLGEVEHRRRRDGSVVGGARGDGRDAGRRRSRRARTGLNIMRAAELLRRARRGSLSASFWNRGIAARSCAFGTPNMMTPSSTASGCASCTAARGRRRELREDRGPRHDHVVEVDVAVPASTRRVGAGSARVRLGAAPARASAATGGRAGRPRSPARSSGERPAGASRPRAHPSPAASAPRRGRRRVAGRAARRVRAGRPARPAPGAACPPRAGPGAPARSRARGAGRRRRCRACRRPPARASRACARASARPAARPARRARSWSSSGTSTRTRPRADVSRNASRTVASRSSATRRGSCPASSSSPSATSAPATSSSATARSIAQRDRRTRCRRTARSTCSTSIAAVRDRLVEQRQRVAHRAGAAHGR